MKPISERAPFSIRFYGLIIDILFSVAFGIVFGYIFGSYTYSWLVPVTEWSPAYPLVGAILGSVLMVLGPILGIGVGVLISFLLNSLFETATGVTLGKIVFGLRIGDLEGRPATQNMLWRRWFAKNIPTICFLLSMLTPFVFFAPIGSIVGFFVFFGSFLALTSHRQTLHDILAGTAVYRRKEMLPRI